MILILFNDSWEDKEVHIFPKGICPKVDDTISLLEYELAYFLSAVQRCNHYTTRNPPLQICLKIIRNNDN